jgi:hypothetical protein
MNLPPPWLPYPRGRARLQYQDDPRKKEVKGTPPPHGLLPSMAAVGLLPPWAAGAVA